MSKKHRNPQLSSLITKFLIGSTIIVWMSSLIQLFFFSQIFSSKSFLLIGYAWAGGLVLDMISVLFFTLPSLVTGKITSGIPVSLLFYMISAIFYGKPSILFVSEQSVFLQSFLKVVEFWLFMLFHFICSIVLPNYVDDFIARRRYK